MRGIFMGRIFRCLYKEFSKLSMSYIFETMALDQIQSYKVSIFPYPMID